MYNLDGQSFVIHLSSFIVKYLFPTDVICSMLMALFISRHSYEWTESCMLIVGAFLHLAIRLTFMIEAWRNWNPFSSERWQQVLSKKDYKVEILASVSAAMLFGFAGYLIWSVFYVLTSYFAMWTVSQLIELAFLKLTIIINNGFHGLRGKE